MLEWRADHTDLREPHDPREKAERYWRGDRGPAVGDVRGYRYRNLAAYILEHGAFFEPQRLPPDIPPRGLGQCYAKAAALAVEAPDRFQYVEGYVLTALFDDPFLHAWCVDARGRVVDCAWADLGRAYRGVIFDLCIVRGRRRRRVPILDSWQTDFPVLRR